tara:strand:- start:222 stop:404 length:183 start_codon:yes stop_codon:yes gene_type:complete
MRASDFNEIEARGVGFSSPSRAQGCFELGWVINKVLLLFEQIVLELKRTLAGLWRRVEFL